MEVAMVEAVLKSSMGRMRRRSRMCMKQERERLDMWLEKERCGSKVTPRLRTGASEVKVRDEELEDRCIEGSWIFLCAYVCMYVCMYECMHVYACMCVCIY